MYCVLICNKKECIKKECIKISNFNKYKPHLFVKHYTAKYIGELYSDKLINSQCFNCNCPIYYSSIDIYIRIILFHNNLIFQDDYISRFSKCTVGIQFSTKPECSFIVGDCYQLYNPKTIIKFNTKREISNITSNLLLHHGKIHELITLYRHGFNIESSRLSYAPNWDQQNILLNLDLLKNYGFEFCYTDIILNYVSSYGHVNVLEWLLNSKLPLKYDEDALNFASSKGYVNVLEWWKNSGLSLKYTENALNLASSHGHVNVLEWWLKSGLPLKYDENALYWASRNGHVNVLEWWKNSGLKSIFETPYILDEYNKFEVIKWWINSGLPVNYKHLSPFKELICRDTLDIEWIFNTVLQIKNAQNTNT
jgi:hypothetical protein